MCPHYPYPYDCVHWLESIEHYYCSECAAILGSDGKILYKQDGKD